jgi:hypothetical protein
MFDSIDVMLYLCNTLLNALPDFHYIVQFIAKLDGQTFTEELRLKLFGELLLEISWYVLHGRKRKEHTTFRRELLLINEYFPCKSNYVRVNIVVCGFKLDSRVGGVCYLCLLAHTELGGTLPVSIINMLSAKTPLKMLIAMEGILKSG